MKNLFALLLLTAFAFGCNKSQPENGSANATGNNNLAAIHKTTTKTG